ncbi:hypothetical protein WJ03_12790 [Burkholderia vietnamiensis]|nr:hypothetical protein WJ03_12790 [Burkholderia vietnamiensis]
MRIAKQLATMPFAALMAVTVLAQQAPTPADQAAAARANVEQERQALQQRDAAVHTPSVRSEVPHVGAYSSIPAETPCFRIDRVALDVPDALPNAVKAQGASALPTDRFAFAREWLEHYTGRCVGKQDLDILVKGLSLTLTGW